MISQHIVRFCITENAPVGSVAYTTKVKRASSDTIGSRRKSIVPKRVWPPWKNFEISKNSQLSFSRGQKDWRWVKILSKHIWLNFYTKLEFLFFFFSPQFETDERPFDHSLLAFDCFHMSQKGHGWVSRLPCSMDQAFWSPYFRSFHADGLVLLYGIIYWKIQAINQWTGCLHANDSIARPKSIHISSLTTITKTMQPNRQSI